MEHIICENLRDVGRQLYASASGAWRYEMGSAESEWTHRIAGFAVRVPSVCQHLNARAASCGSGDVEFAARAHPLRTTAIY